MAYRHPMLALGLTLAVATGAAAARQTPHDAAPAPAPAGGPDTRYCMYVEAVTGSRIETVQCWTRDEWAEQGVDVDRDWAREGVRTFG